MIETPLIILSILFNLLGINSLENKYDSALALLQAGNISNVVASRSIDDVGFPEIIKIPVVKPFSQRPDVLSKHYILVDVTSNKVLAGKNDRERVPIASTTKIMTALVSLENYDLDEVVTVSQKATEQIGADANLRVNEKITVRELLHCLLIKSGNDSAYALAEHYAEEFGVEKFVSAMNQKALDLGLSDTEYKDPAGLDVSGFSTAYDLAKVTREALKNDLFSEITSKPKYTAVDTSDRISHFLENSNRLVTEYNYEGAIGVKTGYMPEAGHCLVSAVTRDNNTLIGVVLNTYTDSASASAVETRKLMDWAWDNIEWE